MPTFEPFRAIRYEPDGADPALVTAPPYDVISPSDRERLIALHPCNVVSIDMPVAGTSDDPTDPYTAAATLFHGWRRDGVLRTDPEPSFTIHRMISIDEDGNEQHTTGVVGALTLSRPDEGEILPHEFTTPKAKSDRLDLLRATHANLSSVWGLSPAVGLSALLHCDDDPLLDFTADEVRHTVWRVTDQARLDEISAAVSAHPVVIADGHHRYETSLAHRDEERLSETGRVGAEAVMCFIVELSSDQLTVGPIHRLVAGLPTDTDIPSLLAEHFDWEPVTSLTAGTIRRLEQRGALGLVTPQGEFLLHPRAGQFDGCRDLDSSRLDLALASLPPHSLTYQHGVDNVREAVGAGEADFGVLLRPVTVEQIVEIAHGGERMPPKSTFFFPKPRTGLVFRSLD